MDGYIKLYRKICDNWLWQDKPFSKGQAWVDLLIQAFFVDTRLPSGNEILEVKAGQVVTSEIKLAERWGWSRHKVRDFIQMLETDSMLTKNRDTKRTVLTLSNYRCYSDLPDSERTAAGQHRDTDKNIKNVKKDIGGNSKQFAPPTLDEVRAYCRERNSPVDPLKFYDFFSAGNWIDSKGKPVKSWKQKIITWERYHTNDKPPEPKAPTRRFVVTGEDNIGNPTGYWIDETGD